MSSSVHLLHWQVGRMSLSLYPFEKDVKFDTHRCHFIMLVSHK
jgi:hypothetical protein